MLKNLYYWIASGFMASNLCSNIALAMTLQKRHCEGYEKCKDGDAKPEAIQRYLYINTI